MLDLSLFRRKAFALGVLAAFIPFLGSTSIQFLIPLYLQSVRGYDATRIGLMLVPTAIAMIVMGPISGRLCDRYGWGALTVGGMAVCATGMYLLSRLTEASPLGLVMAGMILQASGLGIFMTPNTSAILSAVEETGYGVVMALAQLVRNAANVTSVAVATAIVTATMAAMGHPPSLDAVSDASDGGVLLSFTSGLRVTFLVMGSLMVAGVMISFLNRNRPKEWQAAKAVGRQRGGDRPEQI